MDLKLTFIVPSPGSFSRHVSEGPHDIFIPLIHCVSLSFSHPQPLLHPHPRLGSNAVPVENSGARACRCCLVGKCRMCRLPQTPLFLQHVVLGRRKGQSRSIPLEYGLVVYWGLLISSVVPELVRKAALGLCSHTLAQNLHLHQLLCLVPCLVGSEKHPFAVCNPRLSGETRVTPEWKKHA